MEERGRQKLQSYRSAGCRNPPVQSSLFCHHTFGKAAGETTAAPPSVFMLSVCLCVRALQLCPSEICGQRFLVYYSEDLRQRV